MIDYWYEGITDWLDYLETAKRNNSKWGERPDFEDYEDLLNYDDGLKGIMNGIDFDHNSWRYINNELGYIKFAKMTDIDLKQLYRKFDKMREDMMDKCRTGEVEHRFKWIRLKNNG